MEKMKWTRPETTGEMFEANEYVAACITGLIQCATQVMDKPMDR